MTEPVSYLRNAVQAFLERSGIAPSHLSREAVGDPSFVLRLMRGRVPRLDTADRVLAFIGAAPVGPAFRREVETFVRITRTKPYMLGLEAVGDPSFVSRLDRGVSPRLDTVAQVQAWMAAQCNEVERTAIEGVLMSVPDASGDTAEAKEQGDIPMNNNKNKTAIYLGTRDAAAFLGLSPRTLDRYRVTGEGPAFHKFGTRIRYAQADLDAWASARRMLSTSDDGSAGSAARRTV